MRLLSLAFGAACLIFIASCGTKNMVGGFIGQATAELKPGGYLSTASSLFDTNSDVLAVLTQQGDTVNLRFGNTDLLRNCDLEARVRKDVAYIIADRVCETSVNGVYKTINIAGGSIMVDDRYGAAEVQITVDGFSGGSTNGDSFKLNFRGSVKKS